MKKYALLLLPFLLVACQESNEPVVINSTTMSVSKDKITLNEMVHMDSSLVALACGCHFTFSVESFTGDTNVIHYSKRDASLGAYRVAVDVSADTTAASSSYAARIAVLSTGAKGTYRDTIDVTYVK